MSLSSTTNRKVYVGDGSSASFSFPYEFFTTSDLKVFLYDTLSGSVQSQLLNTNYTVSATANSQGIYPNGGSVVMASAIVSTTQIVITRDPSQIQNFILQQNATIPSAPLTQQLDYLTLLVQRQQDLNSSSVRLNDGFNGTFDPRLPTNVIYASNCFLVVNSAATGFTFALNTGGFGPAGLPLVGNGSSQIATYQALLLSGSGVTGVLPIVNGGTGQITASAAISALFGNRASVFGDQLVFSKVEADYYTGSNLKIEADQDRTAEPAMVFGTSDHTQSSMSVVDLYLMSGSDHLNSSANPTGNVHVRTGWQYKGTHQTGQLWHKTGSAVNPAKGDSGAANYGTGDSDNGNSGDVNVSTGIAGANSGNMNLSTGLATGTRGRFFFKDGTEGAIGQVLVSDTTTGRSTWGSIAAGGGGTGYNSNFIQYSLIYASSATGVGMVQSGSSGLVLLANGSAAPSYGAINLASSHVTIGVLPTSRGGTGVGGSSYTQYGVFFASSATQFSQVPAGSSGLVLLTQGSNAPIFGAVSLSGAGVTGTLPVLNGGSGNTGANSSLLQFGVVVMSSLTQMTAIPNSANAGYVLTANAGALPSWQAASTVTQSGILTTVNGGTGVSGSGLTNRVAVWSSLSLGSVTTGGTGSLFTVGGTGGPAWETPAIIENLFVNGGFDFWQALPTGSNCLNTQVGYFPDQWYVQNTTGSAAVAAVTKSNPTILGSVNGLSVQVTTQATATQSNTLEVWQVLDNKTTMGNVINACSLIISAQVKALGQITTLGVQLFSCSGEVKAVGATIGSLAVQSSIAAEQTFTINSNAFSLLCATTTFSYLAGSNGVVAVRFRPIAAQSGFVYSNNAGIVLEQAGLYTSYTSGTTNTNAPPVWSRQGFTANADFYNCLRFYEKSYDSGVAPGAVDPNGQTNWNISANIGLINVRINRKRAVPTLTYYSDVTGATPKVRNNTATVDATVSTQNSGQAAFTIVPLCSSGANVSFHWVADARI